MELKLVSYNIHSGIGADGHCDLARVGAVLREIDADVIALQEVGDFRGKILTERSPEELAEALGMHMAFGPNVVVGGRRYGNAVLSRFPIRSSRNYDLSVHRREPRGALRCDLDLGEARQLHVFCVHLGLGIGERRQQESLLVAADILKDAVRNDPVVVCGDFNYWWNGPVPALVRSAIHDAGQLLGMRQRTYPARLPLLRLDRVFVDDGVEPLALSPHRSALAIRASDHLPLVMRFCTRAQARPQPRHAVQMIA